MSNFIIYAAIFLYLLFLVGVGIIGAKKVKNHSDFALAGGTLGPIPLGLAFTASFFSAATFLGYIGWTYSWGQCAMTWIFLAIFGGSTLGFILLARGVREGVTLHKAETAADWLALAYKSDLLRCVVAVAFLVQIFYIAGQFSAGGVLLSSLISGLGYTPALILVAFVTACYVSVGGLFSDVYTSIGQTILMMFCGLFVFFAGMFAFDGGLTEVSDRLAAMEPHFVALLSPESSHMYSWSAVLGVFLVEFAFAGQPQLLNKIMALKNPKDMKIMIYTWMVAAFCCLAVMFCGSYMKVMNPDLQAPDTAVVEFVRNYPPIISALLMIAILSALMSTACGLMIVIATTISTDVFKKTLVKHRIIPIGEATADKVSLFLMRLMPFLISAACVYLVLNPPKFMGNMIWIGISAVAAATLAPLIVAIYMPRYKSALGAILGAAAGLGFYCWIHLVTGIERSVMAAGAWGMLVSFAVLLGVGHFLGDKNAGKSENSGAPAPTAQP